MNEGIVSLGSASERWELSIGPYRGVLSPMADGAFQIVLMGDDWEIGRVIGPDRSTAVLMAHSYLLGTQAVIIAMKRQ
jgi:hypothetical protein